jgi:ELWxxDGT repeat protein
MNYLHKPLIDMRFLLLGLGLILFIGETKSQQPELVKDIVPGFQSSTFFVQHNAFTLDTLIFFQADDQIAGPELWVSNGSPTATYLLSDIKPGTASSAQLHLINFKDIAYFFAQDEAGFDGSIWRTDGTSNGTYKFFEGCSTGCQKTTSFGILGDKLLFTGTSLNGDELWATDGTIGNTIILKEINIDSADSKPLDFRFFNGLMYFTANNNSTNRELWVTDGTPEGTQQFIDLDGTPATGSNPQILGEAGGYLYFSAVGSLITGRELWKTDGTLPGTSLVSDINPGSNDGVVVTTYAVINDNLLFIADNGTSGMEWWITNGEESGTKLVKDINPDNSVVFRGNVIFSSDSVVVFAADNGVNGRELWKTDGSLTGTYMIKDILPGAESGISIAGFSNLVSQSENKGYFVAKDDIYGIEIWESDGTGTGTKRLTDMSYSVTGESSKYNIKVINDYLLFTAATDEFGYELWKLLVNVPSGANELNHATDLSFSVFPNPSTNHLHISGQIQVPSDILVNLTDMHGRTLLTRKYHQVSDAFIRTIETTGIPTGLYFLTLQTETGISTKQISIFGN